MKLQLALDCLTTEEALNILDKVEDYIDIIEIGTPLLKHEGVSIIRDINEFYPHHEIMVDMKTMDCGKYEADFSFKNGGDLVTVLGCADDDTVKGTIESANNYHGSSQVDLIGVVNKVESAKKFKELGISYIGVHTGIDMQLKGQTPMRDLIEISSVVPSEMISVAGGINLTTLPDIIAVRPGIIVVGGAITGAEDPAQVAKEMDEMIEKALHPAVCNSNTWDGWMDWFFGLLK